MTRNAGAEEKLEGFVTKLVLLGYEVREIRKKPQIYSIDGKLVNIRSRGKSKETIHGRQFWYSVHFSVLREVRWVIYLTTESNYFMMFPSSFLESLKERMYPDRKNTGVGVFDIDWDNEMIVLKHGELERIGKYYRNLRYPADYPMF
jgi:hypothetical protein